MASNRSVGDEARGRRRPANSGSNEALLRELLAGQAATAQRLDDMAERARQTEAVAGEARDIALRINATLQEQNITQRLGEFRVEVRDEIAGLRHDVVAANTNLKKDLTALEARVLALEEDRSKRAGAKDLVQWIFTYTPWLLAGIAAFVAGLLGRDDLLPK